MKDTIQIKPMDFDNTQKKRLQSYTPCWSVLEKLARKRPLNIDWHQLPALSFKSIAPKTTTHFNTKKKSWHLQKKKYERHNITIIVKRWNYNDNEKELEKNWTFKTYT